MAIKATFELEANLTEKKYRYSISFELPDRFKELRVSTEELSVDGVVEEKARVAPSIECHVLLEPAFDTGSTSSAPEILLLGVGALAFFVRRHRGRR